MKKLLFIVLLVSTICSCKKDSTTPAATPAPVVTPVQQDPNLIGVWVQDSSRSGGVTAKDSSIAIAYTRDTIYVAPSSYYEVTWEIYSGLPHISVAGLPYNWQTTNQDSIFIIYINPTYTNVEERTDYSYTITGNKLQLIEPPNSINSGPDGNGITSTAYYWYHKIH